MGYARWDDVPNRDQYTVVDVAVNREDQLLYDQRGPTCGIYSLWKALQQKGANPPVPTKNGVRRQNGVRVQSLRSLAKSNGLTKIGELFDARQVPMLAELAGYNGSEMFDLAGYDEDAFFYLACGLIKDGKFCMIAFSVDTATGEPSRSGLNPHWCLVFGYCKVNKTLLATHWNEFYIFRAVDLWKSNNVLKDFPKSTWGKKYLNDVTSYHKVEGYSPFYKKKANFEAVELASTLGWKLVAI